MKEQSFFHDALQTYKREWIRFDQHTHTQKHLICKALSVHVTLKKRKDFLPFFQDFNSISQTFSRSEKLLGKFQDFFKNSRLCTNPVYIDKFVKSLSWASFLSSPCEAIYESKPHCFSCFLSYSRWWKKMPLYKPVQSLFTKQILRFPQLGKNIHVSYCVLYRGTCIAICLLLWEKVCCRSVGKSLHTDTHTLYMLSWNIIHRYQNYKLF